MEKHSESSRFALKKIKHNDVHDDQHSSKYFK